MEKKKILFVGEASYLATGFSTYWNEILRRLYTKEDLEIAELGSYGSMGDPRIQSVPWKFYPVQPHPQDVRGNQIFRSDVENQFGKNVFDQVCLDFKPSIVCALRDFWMDNFILHSPYRNHYNFLWMLTIDGIPQRDLWLDAYKRCDGCLTYSKWGMDVMKKDGLQETNMITVASPGADLEVFKPPVDKKAHKAKMGIDPNTIIVGCFAKDTPVLMSDFTYKNIQDVRVNDKVIDANGDEQAVTHTHIFSDDKKMLDIEVMGEPDPVTLTHDHEILAVPRSKVLRWVCSTGQKVIWNPMLSDYKSENDYKWIPEFIEPNKLEVGDFWAFKIPDKVNDIEYLVTSEWAEQPKTGKKIPERIPVNEHFLRLAGIYLANGSIKSTKDCEYCSIEIALNSKNIKTKNDIVIAAKELFNLEAKTEIIDENLIRVSIHNVCVARMWFKLFGKYADHKQIPSIFKWLSPEKQLQVVRGWQSGDGCQDGNRNIGISINLNMILWFRLALLRNNIVASINKRNMANGQYFNNAKQQWRLTEKIRGKRHEQFIHNGYLYSPIKNIKDSNYNEAKYDLTIENSHSYVVFCKGVHNTVMRNQKRKLYYDLIEAFSKWVHKTKSKGHLDLVKKTFLYLHTSYPDVGYDIGRAIQEFNVGQKVVMTYMCDHCGVVYPSFFSGEVAICKKCKKMAAHPPNANASCSREVLADIMKTFDLYVQYSICWRKGSKVLMHDYSLKNIEDVKINDCVITHDNRTQTVTQKFQSNTDKIIKLKLWGDSRYYYCTPNHPILVNNNWINAENLTKNDWVCLPLIDINKDLNHQDSYDPYMLGCLIGDGWIDKNNKIGLSFGIKKQRPIKYIESSNINYTKRKKNDAEAFEYMWKDNNFVKEFKNYLGNKSINKSIPGFVFKCSNKYLKEFIKGLFDTDGHINNVDIRYYTSSETLANQLRLLLASLGICSSFNIHNRKNKKNNTEYCLIIKSKESINILRNILFNENNKILSNNKRQIYIKIEDKYLKSKIKNIEIMPTNETVYNIEVEEKGGDTKSSHSYVVGSIACHNCEGWG